jgi:hypothetical protein
MSYKKECDSIKGVYLTWNNDRVFPEYKYNSGPIVSNKILERAKKIVINILTNEQTKIEKAFKLLTRRYKDKYIEISYDYDAAYRRVRSTKLCPASDDCYGESDESGIWICKNKIDYPELVGTILHEALHYFAYFNNKEICEKDEHYVMRALGDDC